MKRIMSLILVITLVLGSASMCYASEWSWQDGTPYVSSGTETEYSVPQWAKSLESKYGIFLEDPNRNVLRGEVYAILLRSMFNCSDRLGYGRITLDKMKNEGRKIYFDDRLEYTKVVQDEIIIAAYYDDLLLGDNGKVKFNEFVTRAEAAKISSQFHFTTTFRYMDGYCKQREFADVPNTIWYWHYIGNSHILGLMRGVDNNNFAPLKI